MPSEYRIIARVQKTHGRVGEVVAVPASGLPLLVHEGLEVAVVPPPLRGPRWRTVLSCSSDGRSGALVALSGAATLDAAAALVGRHLLARRSDLPEDLEMHDAARLVGREVICQDGTLARIESVMTGPANDVWQLRCDSGELLLPVIDGVVSRVDAEGPIAVRVPDGLFWEG